MKLAYVAGPYSARTWFGQALNIWRARKVAKVLWKKGYAVICPHSNSAFMDKCNSYRHFILAYEQILKKCDLLVLLPGWQESFGSEYEQIVARAFDIDSVILRDIKDAHNL